MGWEIATGGTEDENVVELTPEDYTSTATTDDATGDYTPSETFVGKNPKYAFTFSLNDTDKTATITGPVGSPTELDIPSKIIVKGQDYTTTSIENAAFLGCTSLISVNIPNSVTSIGQQAFDGCSSLTSITIPSSVESIGKGAFWGHTSLESITVQEGNEKYRSAGNCIIETATKTLITGCKTSVIPTDGSVTSIGKQAFNGCGLISIIIPDSVASIGDLAFNGCDSLTSITILDGVKSIGQQAFEYCTSLTFVTIGNGVESIGNYAFKNCTSLTSITIPDNVESIGEWTFSDCTSLTSVTIGNNVTSIGRYAFWGCDSLTTVTIDSATIAGLGSSDSELLDNATKVYVISGLTVGSYITGSFTKAASSDREGYVLYTKNA